MLFEVSEYIFDKKSFKFGYQFVMTIIIAKINWTLGARHVAEFFK